MKIKTTIIAIFAAIIIGIGAGTLVLLNTEEAEAPAEPTNETSAVQEAPQETITFTAEAGKSVLDQLTGRAVVETKESDSGVYVDSINGKSGGDDGKYWTLYVNGEIAKVGSAEYITQGGETIEWRFE